MSIKNCKSAGGCANNNNGGSEVEEWALSSLPQMGYYGVLWLNDLLNLSVLQSSDSRCGNGLIIEAKMQCKEWSSHSKILCIFLLKCLLATVPTEAPAQHWARTAISCFYLSGCRRVSIWHRYVVVAIYLEQWPLNCSLFAWSCVSAFTDWSGLLCASVVTDLPLLDNEVSLSSPILFTISEY